MNLTIELRSDRLLLRPINKLDAEAFFKYRSDVITNQYQGWVPKTIDDVQTFISKVAENIDEYDTWFQFAIVLKDTGELIGDIGIHFLDEENYQAEIGCTLAKSQHGKGIANETLKTTIDYLFGDLNKHRISCSVDPNNVASIKMVERLGFRKEAHFKQSILIDGEWVDDIVYALLKSEWGK